MKTTRLFLLVAVVCFVILGGVLHLLQKPAPEPVSQPAAPRVYETHCTLFNTIPEPLCAEPASPCQKIRNSKTTEIDLDESFMILQLVPEQTLLLIEKKDSWGRVRVIDPEWLSDSHQGWVPLERLACKQVDVTPAPAAAPEKQ